MTAQGNFSRAARAALTACAALFCLAAIAPAAAFAGSISGTVTSASTTDPIEGVEVCAYPLVEGEPSEGWVCDSTNAAGAYLIESLEAGEYGVEFWGRPLNYVPQYFDGNTSWWEWDPVVVGSGAVTGVDAELVEGGTIEGAIAEADGGAPVEEAFACAWTTSSEQFGGCTAIDSDGEYALRGLDAEEYEVEFASQDPSLQRQYYDHKANWWEADPVAVSLGAVTSGIDADLLPAAGIEGRVRRARDGAPLSDVEVCARSTDPDGSFWCESPGDDGRYTIGGLPDDSYKVEFWPYDESLPIQYWDHKATWAAASVLSLSSGDVATGIDADLGAPAPGPTPKVLAPPPFVPPPATQPKPTVKRCKKGFRKKRIHGKSRCVKRKKAKRRRHTRSRLGVPSAAALRPGH